MAVYTRVDDEQLDEFLEKYDLGNALAFKGIAEGVENSNYFLETETGRFILTLFEKRIDPEDLPYFISLKQHLASQGFPCPKPIRAKNGEALQVLAGKPAIIVSFLDGLSPRLPSVQQCSEMGAALARMHAGLGTFEMQRENALGPSSWPKLWDGRQSTAEALETGLSELISADLEAIRAAAPEAVDLPQGNIHADLFPDNAFFLGDAFTGVIDFYFACSGPLVYDLAVCLNSWAFEDTRSSAGLEYNYSKGSAMIAGYQSERRLSPAELDILPIMARGAAIRFFLTRLIDWTDTPEDALVQPKDPLDYARRLQFHRRAQSAADYGA